MKKKVKLFTTIASLCLAVSLMAFGVYAATRAIPANVSGSVSFEASNINGEWTQVKVDLTNGTFADETAGTTKTITTKSSDRFTVPAIKIDAQENVEKPTVTIKLTASFKNTSDTVKALLTATKAETGNTETNVTVGYNGLYDEVEQTGGKEAAANNVITTIEVTITYTVQENWAAASAAFDIVFKAAKAA